MSSCLCANVSRCLCCEVEPKLKAPAEPAAKPKEPEPKPKAKVEPEAKPVELKKPAKGISSCVWLCVGFVFKVVDVFSFSSGSKSFCDLNRS